MSAQMKIQLRPSIESELDFVVGAEQNPENNRFVSQWSREQHLAACSSNDLRHLIVETREGCAVGYIILAGFGDTTQNNIEFRRLVITEKNNGYGRDALREVKRLAFEEYQAHRLWLDVKETNRRARHVYEAEGFVPEGVLRECIKTATGYESLCVMSLLRREYENGKAENSEKE